LGSSLRTTDQTYLHTSQSDGYRELKENQRVEFDVKQGDKGLQAENIKVL
jgi:cold shock CspA family protein